MLRARKVSIRYIIVVIVLMSLLFVSIRFVQMIKQLPEEENVEYREPYRY